MRLKVNSILIAAGLALACLSNAQGGQGRRGQRRQNPSIASLVFRTDVQADLVLTEDEKTKLDAMKADLRPPRPAQGERPTREEMQAREEESTKKVEAVLTPDQVKRIHEIQIQILGASALGRKNIQSELGLSADQITKLDALFKTYQEANRSIQTKERSGDLDAATATSERTKNGETLKADAMKILTQDQATKFASMGGRPFTPATPSNQ